MSPLVSIIIVNYNGAAFLPDLFASLAKQSFRDFEIIVVDNASTDASLAFLNSQKRIKLIHSNGNLGFAAGNNLGVKLAVGKYIALLNNDTTVDPNWLKELVGGIEKDSKRGAVVSKIYLAKPGLDKKVLDSAGSLFNNIGTAWSRGYLEEDVGQYDKEEEVPMGTACSLLFRREILDQTYLFDDDYFMYMEELDFNLRLRKLGYQVWYIPSSIVWHRTSQAVRKEIKNAKLKIKNLGLLKHEEVLFKQKYGNANRLNVLAKHYPTELLMRNLHLILLSFVYWDYYFAFWGGWGKFWELKKSQFLMLKKGLRERKEWVYKDREWINFITRQTFGDLLKFKQEVSRKRTRYQE